MFARSSVIMPATASRTCKRNTTSRYRTIAPLPRRLALTIWPMPATLNPNRRKPHRRHKMPYKRSSLICGLISLAMLSGCGPHPAPIKVVAEQRVCPAFPTPPADLLKTVAVPSFLSPSETSIPAR